MALNETNGDVVPELQPTDEEVKQPSPTKKRQKNFLKKGKRAMLSTQTTLKS
jgi:hypothetical protein